MRFLQEHTRLILLLIIPLISLAMHARIFTLDLMGVHVWRQAQTQTNILNFAEEDCNVLNPRINNRGNTDGIFRMEFPVMQWMFGAVYKAVGTDSIIITRVLSFLLSLFSIYGIYLLVMAVSGNKAMAVAGAWCFTFSPVFYYYTMNPLPDNFAMAAGIWGLAYFFRWLKNDRARTLIFSAVLLSLATFAKLPFIVFTAAAITAFFILLSRKKYAGSTMIAVVFILCFLPAIAWYAWVIPGWVGNDVVAGISAGTSGQEVVRVLVHHLISALPESLVNYGAMLFFISALALIFLRKLYRHPLFIYLAACGIGVLLYFFYELNMIGSVHDYYLFPFLPLIFVLVAYGAWFFIGSDRKAMRIAGLIMMAILPLTAYLRMDHRWDPRSPGFNVNVYDHREELKKIVPGDALCIVRDDTPHVLLYYFDKKGWAFNDVNGINSPEDIKDCIENGAQYFYCDKREIDEHEDYKSLLDSVVMQRGDMKVWKLFTPLQIEANREMLREEIVIDTVTSSGNVLKVSIQGTDINIHWGRAGTLRKFVPSEDITGPIRPNIPPDLFSFDDERFIIGYSCGSPCYYALVLPLDSSAAPFERPFPMAYEPVRGLLAYFSAPDTITIENLNDKRIQRVGFTDPKLIGPHLWISVDTVKFDGKFISVRWSDDVSGGRIKRYPIALGKQ